MLTSIEKFSHVMMHLMVTEISEIVRHPDQAVGKGYDNVFTEIAIMPEVHSLFSGNNKLA
jgi:hypothetical protein